MKERPILFSAPMVRAILEGRKTQTRRVVKCDGIDLAGPCGNRLTGDTFLAGRDWVGNHALLRCPYGERGDRLWCKETWNVVPVGRPAPLCGTSEIPKSLPDGWGVMYRASGDQCTKDVGWRPSIYMPRWASRITLEITAVRVERLQDITEEDAEAEGVPKYDALFKDNPKPLRSGYCAIWESIHGPGSWEKNPWVWVLEFRKVEDVK